MNQSIDDRCDNLVVVGYDNRIHDIDLVSCGMLSSYGRTCVGCIHAVEERISIALGDLVALKGNPLCLLSVDPSVREINLTDVEGGAKNLRFVNTGMFESTADGHVCDKRVEGELREVTIKWWPKGSTISTPEKSFVNGSNDFPR